MSKKKQVLSTAALMSQYRKEFTIAEKFVDDTLFAAATGLETAIPDPDEALEAIATRLGGKAMRDARVAANHAEIFLGDIEAAQQIAGVLVGIAFGLRMRGAR